MYTVKVKPISAKVCENCHESERYYWLKHTAWCAVCGHRFGPRANNKADRSAAKLHELTKEHNHG